MTKLLVKLFVRNADDTANAAVRQSYGQLTGITGIVMNVLLFFGKFIVGTVAASVSITADAVNNL